MPDFRKLGIGSIEALLILVIAIMVIGLSLSTSTFLTLPNLFDLLNQSSVNIIFAVGLLVVLIAGGIDISFAVGATREIGGTRSRGDSSLLPWEICVRSGDRRCGHDRILLRLRTG